MYIPIKILVHSFTLKKCSKSIPNCVSFEIIKAIYIQFSKMLYNLKLYTETLALIISLFSHKNEVTRFRIRVTSLAQIACKVKIPRSVTLTRTRRT